ncbi:MAG TPA: alpha/beta hydrolase [Actinomycetota bacterium]|nr:alpha/beta hydrolase [Actinomycetota bacterium]
MERPDTRRTWSGDFSIAYQVVGSGRADLVYLPQFLSNVEWNWQMARHAAFMTRLTSFSRLIVMDPRGVGCSDRLPPGEAAALEDKVDDVLAVMGAAASFRATLFGGGGSAFIAMLAAATPDRFDGLVLFSATPSYVRSDDLPWESSDEEKLQDLDMFRRSTSMREWATTWSRSFAPSLSDTEIRELGSYGAVTSSVGGGVAALESLNRVDPAGPPSDDPGAHPGAPQNPRPDPVGRKRSAARRADPGREARRAPRCRQPRVDR